MKRYLHPVNVVIALLFIGIAMQVIVIFFPSNKNADNLDLLTQQAKEIEMLSKQLQRNDEENKKRDSILLDVFEKNNASREIQLNLTKKSANEKIDHINSPSYNADSIRRYFANN